MRVIELPDGRKIGHGQPVFIVAEVGQNHNGDVYTALRTITAAVNAECDAVKLQKRHLPSDMTAEFASRPYLSEHSFGATYGEHRAKLELPITAYEHLKDRIRYNHWNIMLFATACDQRSVDELEEAISPLLYKVASRDLENLPLIEYIARLGKPVILSRGMSGDREIAEALDAVRKYHDNVVLLHCVSQYPALPETWRLTEIERLRLKFDVLTGLSDHGVGWSACIAATCLGACVIEKHVTLSRSMKGSDHAPSLEPSDLALMVNSVRKVEAAMRGCPVPDVSVAREKLGRSLVATRTIQPEELVTEADLCLKAPGTGLSWRERNRVIGHRARRTVLADSIILDDDVVRDTREDAA